MIGLRLTVNKAGGRVTIRVDGRLSQDGVPDLERTCRQASRPLVLDLTGLVSVDDTGIATLRRLRGEGVELAGPSPYIKLLLAPVTTSARTSPSPSRRRPTRRKRGTSSGEAG